MLGFCLKFESQKNHDYAPCFMLYGCYGPLQGFQTTNVVSANSRSYRYFFLRNESIRSLPSRISREETLPYKVMKTE